MTLMEEIKEIIRMDRLTMWTEEELADILRQAFLKHLPEKKEVIVEQGHITGLVGDPIKRIAQLRNEGWNYYRNEIEGILK
jgi:hypothetical protein